MTASVVPARQEDRRVAALHALGVDKGSREERFDRIVRLAQRMFGVPMASVNLMDRDLMWIKSIVGGDLESGDTAPRGDTFCSVTSAHRGPTSR